MKRREVLAAAGTTLALAGAAGLLALPRSTRAGSRLNSRIAGVQIGTITYSFRSMPDQSAEAMVRYCRDSGVSAIELMGEPAEAFAGMPHSVDMNQVIQMYAVS